MSNFRNSEEIQKLALKVLRDRQIMSQLSNRVYELMLSDLRRQKERSKNYGRYL